MDTLTQRMTWGQFPADLILSYLNEVGGENALFVVYSACPPIFV